MNLRQALQRRYEAPEWACFREVGNGTGSNCRRRADIVAMNLWPSRGMELHGVEIKESRGDWVRERDNPEKAEAVLQYCDRWYLAISEEGIVKAGELPPTWGLLVLKGEKLVEATTAPQLTPKAMTKTFVASLLRHAAESSTDKKELERAVREGRAEAFQEGVKSAECGAGFAQKEFDRLLGEVKAFKEASGVEITGYGDGKDLGETVALVQRITNGRGGRSSMNAMRAEARSAREHADAIEAAANAIEALMHPKERT